MVTGNMKMNYRIFASESGKFYTTEVHGDITSENCKEYIIASRDFGMEHEINCCLLDVRDAINKSSVIQNYNFGYKDELVNSADRARKLAILVNEGDTSHNFVITVLKNAGFNICTFTSYDEAAAWLKG